MEKAVRVLVADASPEQTQLLRTALEEEDFTVVAAVNTGEEAYEKLQEAEVDVLVTDLLLPGLDGLSLLRQLRDEGGMPRTIILSAFWNDRMARSATNLGIDDYLAKPCRAEVLFARIRELMETDHLHRCIGEPTIRRVLMNFHIPTHLDGYKYICEGLSRALADRTSLQGVTKVLYRDIAKEFHTTPVCVEHSMRTAIIAAWKKGSAESRHRCFGAVFDGCEKAPSNINFLSSMAEFIDLSDNSARNIR